MEGRKNRALQAGKRAMINHAWAVEVNTWSGSMQGIQRGMYFWILSYDAL